MNINVKLSEGSIAAMYADASYTSHCVLQVLDVKKMPNQGEKSDRYRLMISDGVNYIPAMLSTQLSELVVNGTIQEKCIVRLTEYMCNPIPKGSKIVVILTVEPVAGPLEAFIGHPVDIALSKNTVPAQQASTPTVVPNYVPNVPFVHQSQTKPVTQPLEMIDKTTGQVIVHIKALDPYLPKWTIRARVSEKSQMKGWSNERGSGQLFSFTLIDETGEIRATLFNEAANMFYPLINQDSVYLISGGKLQFAKKNFTNVQNQYELTLDTNAKVVPLSDGVDTIPHNHWNFVEIDNIQDKEKGDMIDVCGIVLSFKPVSVVNTSKGETSKRSILIGDNSNRAIELTLWGQDATAFDQTIQTHGPHPILAMKGVRVSDFGGKCLSSMGSTAVTINPPGLPKAQAVQNWFSTINPDSVPSLTMGGSSGGAPTYNPSQDKTLASIHDEQLGHGQNPDYIQVPNVTITSFKKDAKSLWYRACANPSCKGRKVYEEGSNWKCQLCGQVNNTRLRWVTNATGYDATGKEFLRGFGEPGVVLLGLEADDMARLQEANDPQFYKIWEDGRFKQYHMRLSVSNETYQESVRTKVTIQSATPVDPVTDSKRLIAKIEAAFH